LLTSLAGDVLDAKRQGYLKELGEAQDLQNSLLEKQQEASKRSRYLRKQLGLLSKQEEEMFARENASIAQIEYLEQDVARSQEESSEPSGSSARVDPAPSESALSPFAFDFSGEELPDDWSFSRILSTDGTA
jgi:hypothetical protein